MADEEKLIREFYGAFNRRQADRAREFFDESAVWRPNPQDPEQDVRHGVEEMMDGIASLWEAFDELLTEPEAIIEAGERFVVPVKHTARGRESGATTERHEVHVITLSGGKIIEFAEYPDRAAAFEALGLPPPRA